MGYKKNIRLKGRLESHWGVKMESHLKMLANEVVCRQNRLPPNVHTLIPVICKYVTFYGYRDFVGVTGVKDLETGDGPELSRWVQPNCMSPSTHGSFPGTDRRGRRDRKCERTWPAALFPTYLRRLTSFRLLLKCRFFSVGLPWPLKTGNHYPSQTQESLLPPSQSILSH